MRPRAISSRRVRLESRAETFASRHSLSYLTNIGITETIAASRQEYIATALSLAGDLRRMAALRAGLRARMATSPLCDGKRFAENWMAVIVAAVGKMIRLCT